MTNPLSPELIQQIRLISGMRIPELDHERLSAWVEKRIQSLCLKTQIDYLHYLIRSDDLSEDRQMLCDLLTTGETFFMRDPGQMELIRRVILPAIISKENTLKLIRIWAPACATGEEIYSLLILLEQVLPQIDNWEIDIVGSDINPIFIEQAKKAIYGDWSFRGCNADFKNAYFHKVDGGWKLIDRIRSRARFLVFDLVKGVLPNPSHHLADINFILCRNLFIYMNTEAINLIAEKLSACLKSGGVLMTAHGELHAYRQSGLQVKIYPESLVYEKPQKGFESELVEIDKLPSPLLGELNLSQLEKTTLLDLPKIQAKPIPQLLSLAWYFADQGKFTEGLKIYQEIISRDSMIAELHYLHSVISLEMGDFERAKEDLRKTLYLDPQFLPAYLEMITIHIQEGKGHLVSKYCDQALHIIELMGADVVLPILKNNTASDLREYLKNLQNSLTSVKP
ncbi:CheR family methyltransferase [Polynucleobacter arcticus]|uniref:CheR-type methyltransferase domain-containing protein n=1 Tax=Polynucleobacter arcticus TaxID=1743165 RepID=A0A6M9PJR3_9BURK|nr:CheR family methyltransferase [Polynucleobacter arcticus]QKM60182.1 hypothetical protein DN92_03500 [Polynucleobacter arcticus]